MVDLSFAFYILSCPLLSSYSHYSIYYYIYYFIYYYIYDYIDYY